MRHDRHFQQAPGREAIRGYSVVELMVALGIGMFLIATFIVAVSTSSANNRSNERSSDLQNNAAGALQVLQRDINHAGYRGLTWPDPAATGLPAVTGDCAAGFSVNLRQGIWASNNANPFSATCIPAANYAGGDILVIRRAGLTAATSLTATRLYLRSAYERAEVFLGSTPPTFAESPNEDRTLQVIVYYISPYSYSATENPQIPALYRITRGAGPAMGTPELVAPGIEAMELQFGRLATDGTTQYQNANAVSTAATSTTTDPSEWDDVNAVRVFLLVRSFTPEPGYSNTSTYTLGDRTITVNDRLRRELITTTLQVRR